MTAVLQAHDRAQADRRGELKELALTELHESPWNPRNHYSPDKLHELAESLAAQGQLTPIVVRPRQEGGYEIGAGHRRTRAAALAGLRKLLAVVRPLDDVAFTELLNIENLQRDDLHPLEEAGGFRDLMERAGYDVAKIAARVGRSTKYVYDRVKLLQLVPEARKMFLAGEFEAGHAIILARLSPADQKRALDRDRSGNGRIGGLFYPEYAHADPNLPAQEQMKLEEAVKPVSVREFQTWVDDNVRMVPDRIDPMLFPQTAELLAQAKDEELKVVHITHDYRVPDAARDEKQRTYGEHAWKRADGKQKSRECDYAVLGVVVAGPGAGEAFRVCVRKDKCKVHWEAEQRQLVRDRKYRQKMTGGDQLDSSVQDRYERERAKHLAAQAQREAERARWKKATPAILKAVAARVGVWRQPGATSVLGRYLLEYVRDDVGVPVPCHLSPGRNAEDLVRYLGFLLLASVLDDYDVVDAAPRQLKPFGIDAKKLVDQVAPLPKQATVTTKKPSPKTKRGRHAARRS